MAEHLKPVQAPDHPILLEPPMQPGEFELAARHFRDQGQWPDLAQRPREAIVYRYRWLADAS